MKEKTKWFGEFEVKVSETEAVIQDKKCEAFSFVYYMGSQEHALLTFLINRDDKEADRGLEMLVYLMASTRLMFAHNSFKNGMFKLLMEHIGEDKPLADEDETEEEIIKELRREQEEKEKFMKGE